MMRAAYSKGPRYVPRVHTLSDKFTKGVDGTPMTSIKITVLERDAYKRLAGFDRAAVDRTRDLMSIIDAEGPSFRIVVETVGKLLRGEKSVYGSLVEVASPLQRLMLKCADGQLLPAFRFLMDLYVDLRGARVDCKVACIPFEKAIQSAVFYAMCKGVYVYAESDSCPFESFYTMDKEAVTLMACLRDAYPGRFFLGDGVPLVRLAASEEECTRDVDKVLQFFQAVTEAFGQKEAPHQEISVSWRDRVKILGWLRGLEVENPGYQSKFYVDVCEDGFLRTFERVTFGECYVIANREFCGSVGAESGAGAAGAAGAAGGERTKGPFGCGALNADFCVCRKCLHGRGYMHDGSIKEGAKVFRMGFDPVKQYEYMEVQAGREVAEGGTVGILDMAFSMHTLNGMYAFKDGLGMGLGEDVEGFDARNFDTEESGDEDLNFPDEYEARVDEEARFARVCEEEYAGGAAVGGAGAGLGRRPWACLDDIGERLEEEAPVAAPAPAVVAAPAAAVVAALVAAPVAAAPAAAAVVVDPKGKRPAKVGDLISVVSFRESKIPGSKAPSKFFTATVAVVEDDCFYVQFDGRDYVNKNYPVPQAKQGSLWKHGIGAKPRLIGPDRMLDRREESTRVVLTEGDKLEMIKSSMATGVALLEEAFGAAVVSGTAAAAGAAAGAAAASVETEEEEEEPYVPKSPSYPAPVSPPASARPRKSKKRASELTRVMDEALRAFKRPAFVESSDAAGGAGAGSGAAGGGGEEPPLVKGSKITLLDLWDSDANIVDLTPTPGLVTCVNKHTFDFRILDKKAALGSGKLLDVDVQCSTPGLRGVAWLHGWDFSGVSEEQKKEFIAECDARLGR